MQMNEMPYWTGNVESVRGMPVRGVIPLPIIPLTRFGCGISADSVSSGSKSGIDPQKQTKATKPEPFVAFVAFCSNPNSTGATRCIPDGYRGFPPFHATFPGHNPLYSRRLRHFPPVFVFFYFTNPNSTEGNEGNEGGLNRLFPAGNPDKPAYKWLVRKARTGSTRLNPDKPTSVFFGEGIGLWQGNKRQRNNTSELSNSPAVYSSASFKAVSGTFSGCRQLSTASRHLINPKSSACRHLTPPIAACCRLPRDKFFSHGDAVRSTPGQPGKICRVGLPFSASSRLCAKSISVNPRPSRLRRALMWQAVVKGIPFAIVHLKFFRSSWNSGGGRLMVMLKETGQSPLAKPMEMGCHTLDSR
jgi:hypothetical protein